MPPVNHNGHASIANSGLKGRPRKAKKVLGRIINSERFAKLPYRVKILEVGCGSGHLASEMANYFVNSTITGIDIEDRIQIRKPLNFEFKVIKEGLEYEFLDDTFHLIVLNQVLEHVKPRDRELLISELKRVLHPDGFAWFAFPNKLNLIEPHYYIPLLSIMHKKIADKLVRLFKLGNEYDCYPLTTWKAKSVFNIWFGGIRDETVENIFFLLLPNWKKYRLIRTMSRLSIFSPTLVFTTTK